MGCSQSKEAVPPPATPKAVPKPSVEAAATTTPRTTATKPPLPVRKVESSGPRDEAKENPRGRFDSFASGASTPEDRSMGDDNASVGSSRSVGSNRSGGLKKGKPSNPKMLSHSASAIGLDEMIEDRREVGDLRQNVVHIEVPFGKPIEEVYDGVHTGPVLGSGISGLVRLVTHKATGLKYAVKVLDLGLVETAEGLRQLREEIFIMCQLDHPNIVRLEEVYESTNEIYLVQELCLGGELFDRLDEQPDYHYTEGECARLVKHMLSAVRYLHSRGIIHRDLKLENFLFSSTAQDSELKMIDFGLSKHFRYGEVHHEAVGTPYTVAPEVIRGSYDERCDIWAIGVIAFLLLSGDPPFGGCGGPEPLMTVRANILKCSYSFEPAYIWEHVSESARQFIRDMLVTDPKKRPTAREAQKHKWLQDWANRARKGTDNALNPNVVSALVNFKEFSDMRKLLCEVLSFTLLPDQIKDLRREFEKMDTDGSGEISLGALKQVLMTNAGAGSLGALTEDEVTDIFDAMRVRKTETRIHWHEFIAAGLSQCQVDDRNLRLAFDRLDSDHKGYITLDDIMDLMGSDAAQSEDEMRRMWGDSIKAVKCQHARITYDDFLLLMKGQTKDASPVPTMTKPIIMPTALDGMENTMMPSIASRKLHVVPEVDASVDESSLSLKPVNVTKDEDEDDFGGLIIEDDLDALLDRRTPTRTSPIVVKSAPSTPADHKLLIPTECIDSPLSMDDDADIDIEESGPGVPGSLASLTPPSSPRRGATDYITPSGGWRATVEVKQSKSEELDIPGIPGRPLAYTRRRSRSLGNEEDKDEVAKKKDLQPVAEVVREMLLPETDHLHNSGLLDDKSKSALKTNRQLYRAHRQMRLAVLDASKRFEEQQAAHARDFILAQRETEEKSMGMIQAGLVMRHGHTKQVSSEAIRQLLQSNQAQQQALVEKANRRGGRGRRSRKKTISDMSGMLASIGQDEMGTIATQAEKSESPDLTAMKSVGSIPMDDVAPVVPEGPDLPDLSSKGNLRKATVPGEFRATQDPFSLRGLYGAAAANWK